MAGNIETIETFIKGNLRNWGVPGLSMAVVKNDKIAWMKGFGLADLTAKTPANPETIFMWFSMTKLVTATAIMQLADLKKLKLDDPATKYVPNFHNSDVTIRHLLNHSSGLPNPMPIKWVHPAFKSGPEPDKFLNELLSKYGQNLKSKPGEKASYSNLGYIVLGAIVAAASGKQYTDYVLENILKPVGMQQTSFAYSSDIIGNVATGYQKSLSMMAVLLPFLGIPPGILGRSERGYRAFNRFYVDGAPYGGLIGPICDAARFVQAHLNHGLINGTRLLTPESTMMMQQISSRGRPLNVAFGWYRQRDDNIDSRSYLEHLGGGAGFFNIMRIYPTESLGIVIMGNSTSYDINAVIDVVSAANWS